MQEKTSVETITRNLPLAVLKPDQVEKLLKGQHAPDLSVAQLLKARASFNQNFPNSMHCVLPEILGCLRGVLGVWRALKVAHDEQLSQKVQAIQRYSLDKQ